MSDSSVFSDVQAIQDAAAAPILAAQHNGQGFKAEAKKILDTFRASEAALRRRLASIQAEVNAAAAVRVSHPEVQRRWREVCGDALGFPGLLGAFPVMCQALINEIDGFDALGFSVGRHRDWPGDLANLRTCFGTLHEHVEKMEQFHLPELRQWVAELAQGGVPAATVTVPEPAARAREIKVETGGGPRPPI